MKIQYFISAPISESLCEDIFCIAILEAIEKWAVIEWLDLEGHKACVVPRHALIESEESVKARMKQDVMQHNRYLINLDKIAEAIATYCNLDCETTQLTSTFRDQLIIAVFSNNSANIDAITTSYIIQIICFDKILFP